MTNQRIKKGFMAIFLIISLVMYIIILIKDYKNPSNNNLKYSFIIICLVFTIINPSLKIDSFIVRGALIFTLISDYFLLYKTNFLPGIITFCVVQILYFIRLSIVTKHLIIKIIIRLIIILSVSTILSIVTMMSFFTVFIYAFYFLNLLINCIESFILTKNSKSMWVFAVGLLLFVFCDICVGLHNLNDFITVLSLTNKQKNLIACGMWFFYIPSQTLIVLSAYLKDYNCLNYYSTK